MSFFILCITAECSYAQNLVPNYSFEVYDTCPFSAGQIYYAPPWTDPTHATSDYFNSCNAAGCGTPSNYEGIQTAKDGIAYAGFVAYADTPSVNLREYIQTQLLGVLTANKCYQLTFYASVGDNTKYNTNKLSAYFSDTAISSCTQCFLPFIPQINYIDASGIGNSSSWYKVEGTFKAHGGEQYITIGNFNTDINTTVGIVNPGQPGFAYYYIDSVSLVQVTCPIDIGINENTKPNSVFNLSPNPSNGNMILKYSLKSNDKAEMKIYDVTGRLINSYKLTEGDNNTLKISEDELQNGIYFYNVIIDNKVKSQSKIVIVK